uniref:colicin-like pore-forming protein n=1 Tax=Pseudomonas fluorescens TaxID=294 RepID=UPI00178565D6|nr:colicin-like pore-forming protein [Pseudomonas fluorescens]
MAEFMNEQIANQKEIDATYIVRFKTLTADTERELEQKKVAAKAGQNLAPAQAAAAEQKAVVELIAAKKALYITVVTQMYGMHGQSPYFLMSVLPPQMMHEFLNSGKVTPDGLVKLWALYDDVYKAALEAKSLSLAVSVIAGKLAGLAQQRDQIDAQAVPTVQQQDQRLALIAQERDIHFQQLPEFLQTEVVKSAGVVENMSTAQALNHYKMLMQQLAAANLAAVGPIVAPPPYSRGGITVTFPANNPKINAPLSQPELEALKELVFLQNNTKLGRKWVSYHDALLKQESARQLNETAAALGGLADRAADADQIKDALKFTADFYKEVTAKYGEKASALAKELADKAQGKRIRNAQQALNAFDQYKGVLDKKFSVKDRQAIANTLEALDNERMSKDLARLSKAFGSVGNVMDFVDLATEARKATQTGNWLPFFIKAETILAGKGATAAVAAVFGMMTGATLGLLGFALLMAVASALVTDERVTELNDFILAL